MRIISGFLGGRKLLPPANKWPTRPTTDFAREGLFNILQNRIDFSSSIMLDLFGGTGSHSFEFISRGCRNATYVDQFKGCVDFVSKTAREWNVEEFIRIVKNDVFRFISSTPQQYTYIFAGPPYPLKNLDEIPSKIFQYKILEPEGIFVLEHNPKHSFTKESHFLFARNYGTTIFSFFSEHLRN